MSATGISPQAVVIGLAIALIAVVVLICLFRLKSSNQTRAQDENGRSEEFAPATAPIVAAAQQDEEDEIAAVIAAVMAMCQDSGNGLIVRSVRHVGKNAPAWSIAGRQSNIFE